MKNVRIWFEKRDTARYISHLDLNRCMSRAFHKTRLPLWYTQGFNPHVFVSFAMPLSLGMDGLRECMDVRLLEEMDKATLMEKLNGALPLDIHVYDVTEPVMATHEIAFAHYEISYDPDPVPAGEAEKILRDVMGREELIVEKHTKKGPKDFNLAPYLNDWSLKTEEGRLHLSITLPIGLSGGVNPSLVKSAAEKYGGLTLFDRTARTCLYNEKMEPYR